VSGAIGRQKIHFEAPPADKLNDEVNLFLDWFNQKLAIDPVLKTGLAHLWLVTLSRW
jgi:Fic family protein